MTGADREKLDILSEVMGRFAHDLSNLLATIVLNLNLIEHKSADPTAVWFASSALRAADRGANLANRLLAFVGKQKLECAATDLPDLVSGIRDVLSRTAGPTVELMLSPAAQGLWQALVDRDQIEFALVNLAENARDAMPRGGRMTIGFANTKVTEPSPELAAGDYVVLTVEDSGEGPSTEAMARAFEPFFSTRRSHEHPGLGLSAVLGIAKAHRGGVRLGRAPEGGCRVELFLRRASDAEAQSSAEPASNAPEPKRLATVLVVDDDPDLLAVTQEGLVNFGCDVLLADAGPAALDVVASNPEIDLLIVDVNLGGMTGPELIRRARERRPGLKALIMTGGADIPGSRQGTGRLPLLSKPFRAADLARAVAVALSKEPNR